tara:strand:+ start:1211 stop:1744 length:534 start_codon:yes stop_codon:yes gene_type:complete
LWLGQLVWEEVANNNLSWTGFLCCLVKVCVEDGPRKYNLENTIMTKKTLTLVERKLAVLDWFNGLQDVAPNERFIESIAKDECYTSKNSLDYKKRMLADRLADYEDAAEQKQHIKMDALQKLIDNVEDELALLETRHEADLSVYEQVTGKSWEPAPKKTRPVSMSKERLAALKARVA